MGLDFQRKSILQALATPNQRARRRRAPRSHYKVLYGVRSVTKYAVGRSPWQGPVRRLSLNDAEPLVTSGALSQSPEL